MEGVVRTLKTPSIHSTAFVHSSAVIIGDVVLSEYANIWPGTVLRGDINRIQVGRYTNIQDLSLCHVDVDAPCVIGDYVVCGHQVTLHGSKVGNNCLIGIGAVILSHTVIEPHVIVGANSLVPEGKVLEGGFVYYGSPVKKMRPLRDDERALIQKRAEDYVRLAKAYAQGKFVKL